MSISHYTVPIPPSATICSDWACLCDEVLKWPDNMLDTSLPSGVSIANYTVPIPESAKIVSKYPSLEAAALERPHAQIVKKYGGYVIEEDGIIVIPCDDQMSDEIETHPGCLDYIFEDVAELKRTKGGSRSSSAL